MALGRAAGICVRVCGGHTATSLSLFGMHESLGPVEVTENALGEGLEQSGAMDGVEHPDVADGLDHSLDTRWVPYQRRVAWVTSAFLAIGLAGAAAILILVAELPALPILVAATALAIANAAFSQWWPAVAYRHASYRLDGRTLEIRRGVLWRKVIAVPRSRIQHSDVSQGPFERMHGLGTLSVFTAGARYALVRLNGLDHARALAMREHLMQADDDDVV